MADGPSTIAVCEQTHAAHGKCDYCGDPLPPPSPKWHGKVRRFCCASHRTKWHREEQLRLVQRVLDAATDLQRFMGGDRR